MPQALTIAQAEARVLRGLKQLTKYPVTDPDAAFALSVLVKADFHTVVQLEEDGRKKRNEAPFSEWSPELGELHFHFEPAKSQPGAVCPVSAVEPQRAAGLSNRTSSDEAVTAEVKECCLALAEAERQGKPFIGLKWFRDTALPQQSYEWAASPQDRFRVLNQAIAEGLIETQSLANPMNPAHPTTTLRLNREKTRGIVGSRFNPIPLRGEPLSSIIIRERGER